MSTFSRTTSGISNYHLFYGADFTVFIEGKIAEEKNGETPKVIDVYYYEYVLGAASKGKKPKIKCVGNKSVALEYARKIQDGEISSGVVIVDKDLEGVISSELAVFPIIRTFGYSWENELWSVSTVKAILTDLTNSQEKVNAQVDMYLPRLAKRLKYVSMLDAAMQTNGQALLKKKTALGGVAFSYPLIKARELRRVSANYKMSPISNCPIAKEIIHASFGLDWRQVIQGHFWSNMVLRFITALYKKVSDDHTPSNTLLTNLALSNLRRDPTAAVGNEIIARYTAELARVGV